MEVKHLKDRNEPKGGWMMPPDTTGVPPVAEYRVVGKGRKAKMVRVPLKLSKKDKKARKAWQKAMDKHDSKPKKRKWRFVWKSSKSK